MKPKLLKNIISTLCYYDALDYPLTSFEVWKFLINVASRTGDDESFGLSQEEMTLGKIIEALESDEVRRVTDEFRGFYFLKGRKNLVEERIRRGKISVLKIKRLSNVVKLLRWIPFLRMVAVTGRLATKNAQIKSDWDLLVVFRVNRIWIGRTFMTVWTHLIGKRRYGNKIKDRVCLNHFITTDSMEIFDKNLFSANEYMSCIPIFDANNYHESFQVKNGWIGDVKPNYYLNISRHMRMMKDSEATAYLRRFFEKIFDRDWLEVNLRKIEKKKIEENPNTKKEGSFIEATDRALIFLPEPQGPVVFEKYQKRLEKISAGLV